MREIIKMIETYGKQSLIPRIKTMVKERFTITENMNKYSKFEVYKPKLNKKWLGLSIVCVVLAIATTPIPLTGAALYPAAFICFRKC